MPPAIPMTEKIIVPGYTITAKLGQGGMASVYLAVQHSFERQVALKVMSPLLNSDPSFAARFKREARIVAQLSHASIVPVYEVGEHQSLHYLSMEYLSGGDLKRRILDGEGDLSLALNVCTALSAALDVAHRKGFVHRDIKPENILFREDGTPVLTDFGIARALDSGRSMTLAGMLVGTPDYMSPEQVKGLELEGRSDLYSLGIVFYEILTGAAPFKAESDLSLALKQLGEPLPPLPPEYAAYQEFLDCLTAKDREHRFASGAEVIRALRVIGIAPGARSRPAGGLSAGTLVSQPTLARPPVTRPTGVSYSPEPPTASLQATVVGAAEAPSSSGAIGSAEPEKVAVSQAGADEPVASEGGGSAHWMQRFAQRGQPVWMGAAALAALAVGLTLIIRGLHHSPGASLTPGVANHADVTTLHTDRVGGSAMPPENPTSVATSGNSASAAVVPTLTSVSTSTSTSDTRTAAIPAAQTPSPTTRAPSSEGVAAIPSVDDASAAALRKRLAEERRQRKEKWARLIEQHAAELRAAQLQEQQARIQELLVAAKSDYAAGALWQPAGANAADRYREVLRMQPEQTEALAGARRVADVLAAEAAQTESVGDVYTAKLLIDQVQSLQPDHPRLPDLQARLEQLLTTPAGPDARERIRLEKAAKYIARAQEDLGRQPLDFRAVDDATDQYDKAVSSASMAPGLPSLKERLVAAYATAVKTELSNNEPKRAQKLINTAHKRKWSSDELEQLEASLHSGDRPAAPIKEAGAGGTKD